MYFCLVKVSCSLFNFLVAIGWPFKGYIRHLSNLVWNQERTTYQQSHLLLCLSRVIFLSYNNEKRYRKVSGHHSYSKPVSIPCSGKCSMEEAVGRRFWPMCTFSFFYLYSIESKTQNEVDKREQHCCLGNFDPCLPLQYMTVLPSSITPDVSRITDTQLK